MQVQRTFTCKIENHDQVESLLNENGVIASKLWNIARYYTQERWDDDGEIPSYAELCRELKNHEHYKRLPNHTAQQVFKELSEAFHSWFEKRKNGDERARPPLYRKKNGKYPLSTLTYKRYHFKINENDNLIRLSKGRTKGTKERKYLWLKISPPPTADLSNPKEVKLVHTDDKWEAHVSCKVEMVDRESPGDEVAGIDLGIVNFSAVAYPHENHLYKGDKLKEDEYYFLKKIARCESGSRKAKKLHRARSRRRKHFLHAWASHVIKTAKEKKVGVIGVGYPERIREDEDGEPVNWGKHGNLDLHSWPFDRAFRILKYNGESERIQVIRVDERDSSKTCNACGHKDKKNRIHRGLFKCGECGVELNADVNGARNIREKTIREVTQTPSRGMSNVSPGTTTGEAPLYLQRWSREGTFSKVSA